MVWWMGGPRGPLCFHSGGSPYMTLPQRDGVSQFKLSRECISCRNHRSLSYFVDVIHGRPQGHLSRGIATEYILRTTWRCWYAGRWERGRKKAWSSFPRGDGIHGIHRFHAFLSRGRTSTHSPCWVMNGWSHPINDNENDPFSANNNS